MANEVIKGQAMYFGGHFLHPPSMNGDLGNITITDDKITFEKIGFLVLSGK